ncbi:MAG: hypothetical protein ABIP08_06465, partial [Lautropia sp.]
MTKLPTGRKNNYAFKIEAPRSLVDEIQRQTLVGRWQRREDYDPIQFDGLVARLREEIQAILQAQGYYRATTSVESLPGRVTVKVEPGPQATVSKTSLRITGPAADNPKLMSQFESIPDLRQGQPFISSAWQGGKRSVVDALNRQGYLRAEVVSSEARVDVAGSTVSLDLVVDSGPRIAFGNLEITGLQRYDRGLIE